MSELAFHLKQMRDVVDKKVRSCASQCDWWRAGHGKSMAVLDIEDIIADMVSAFDMISRVDKYYGKIIRKQPSLYDYDVDESLKTIYRTYLSEARQIYADARCRINEGYAVSNAEPLREIICKMERAEERDFDGESIDLAYTLTPDVETLRLLASSRQ